MTDSLREFITGHPWVLLVISVVGFAGMFFVGQRLQALRAAKEMVEKQYDPLPDDLIDGLVQYGEQQHQKKTVLALLRIIRTHHGRDGVRYGHIYWIDAVLKEGTNPEEIDQVPSFRAPSSSV